MEKIRFGRTQLSVSRTAFGCIPIQRLDFAGSKKLLLKAHHEGINFFDTARMYTDSEEKIGNAFKEIRKDIIIATKTMKTDAGSIMEELHTSLKNLKTDYIDIYQLHNPQALSDPDDPDGALSALLNAKKRGLIRFVGFTNHRLDITKDALKSGFYDTIQFPVNYLSTPDEIDLICLCKEYDAGFIVMKALSGGLITNAKNAFVFLRQFENAVPIWGIQHEAELDEILGYEKNPPDFDEEINRSIEKDKRELSGNFCRACGYCMPCPVNIPINMAARMSLLLRRMPYEQFMTDSIFAAMQNIDNCTNCGKCKNKCPYKLDTPVLLKEMQADYMAFYKKHKK